MVSQQQLRGRKGRTKRLFIEYEHNYSSLFLRKYKYSQNKKHAILCIFSDHLNDFLEFNKIVSIRLLVAMVQLGERLPKNGLTDFLRIILAKTVILEL